MFRPIPYPILTGGHRSYVERAHRERSAAVAELVRTLARWVSRAAS